MPPSGRSGSGHPARSARRAPRTNPPLFATSTAASATSSLAFSVAGAFFSAAAGGWVAVKIAGICRSEPAMLHGAIVWSLGIPILLVLASMGATGCLGAWYGGFGPAARSVSDAIAVRNSALGGVTALLIGLVGGVLGGWMASGEPMTFARRRAAGMDAYRRREIAS